VSSRPFIAARIEEWITRRAESIVLRLGWEPRVIGYTGYGNPREMRVLGRLILVPKSTLVVQEAERFLARRGWRNFVSLPCVSRPATVSYGDRSIDVPSDRQGYIDAILPTDGLGTGWTMVTLDADGAEPVSADVLIIGDDQTFGLVSDIDDTVLSTWLPRLFLAAWNSFVLTESRRQPVPGMAEMYAALLDRYPDSPVMYLSTGSWDTYAFLRRFLARHHYPVGPMMLTDWGPTNTGWFRSGRDHKTNALRLLARDFPQVRWLLVGDDGQHDPMIYAEFAEQCPNQVSAIAIRELNPVEQMLAHGTPGERLDTVPVEDAAVRRPTVRGPEGYTLLRKVLRVLGR
jgi:phosphatidate phosphatase APP1